MDGLALERAEPEEESRGWALGNTDCPSSWLGGALKKTMVYLATLGLGYDTWDLRSSLWLAGSSLERGLPSALRIGSLGHWTPWKSLGGDIQST